MLSQVPLQLVATLLSVSTIYTQLAWTYKVGDPCGTQDLFFECVKNTSTDYLVCSSNQHIIQKTCDKGLFCASNTHIGDLNYCRPRSNDGHRMRTIEARSQRSNKQGNRTTEANKIPC
ncbi:hypothetical protein BDF22DRAFT_673208 [Syncephalis plumigaleata]|nr:hypothetical protein BDF22DRAFT_673208 [Syncephalis plumigaleata]